MHDAMIGFPLMHTVVDVKHEHAGWCVCTCMAVCLYCMDVVCSQEITLPAC